MTNKKVPRIADIVCVDMKQKMKEEIRKLLEVMVQQVKDHVPEK